MTICWWKCFNVIPILHTVCLYVQEWGNNSNNNSFNIHKMGVTVRSTFTHSMFVCTMRDGDWGAWLNPLLYDTRHLYPFNIKFYPSLYVQREKRGWIHAPLVPVQYQRPRSHPYRYPHLYSHQVVIQYCIQYTIYMGLSACNNLANNLVTAHKIVHTCVVIMSFAVCQHIVSKSCSVPILQQKSKFEPALFQWDLF